MKSVAVLQRVLERQTASLAQYLAQSWPWVRPDQQRIKEFIQRVAEEERQASERLAELIDRRDGVPVPGTFPDDYSELHYVSADVALARLCEYLRDSIKELERDLEQLADDSEAAELIKEILKQKRSQLAEAEQLSTPLKQAG